MKLTLFLTLATVAGTASAFRPSSKAPLRQNANKNKVTSDVRPGAPLTKADMVAIRSPFWNAMGSQSKAPAAKIDYVVDRDYTVALTLLCVGIWLTMFHPSEFGVYLMYLSATIQLKNLL